ncbi:MAG: asparagine synthase (glutamine-hydrolyzing) [Lachnospiraceae bacterium]|nr:asparagine synthase (glutamine-hydrolyzing) [Lachnospiraceae bacterium]
MCGIAGFISERNDRAAVLKKMTDALIHRGPDAEGFWLDEQSGVSLGHRRLSIRDLSDTGAQPMSSADGRFVMVYNGEIYNAEELKGKLAEQSEGLRFRGSSDTEILLEAFAHLGIRETLEFSKGMFALALYDRKKKEMWLMRDRIGEKPLYYGRVGGDFVFASELSAIAAYPGFTGKIDRSVIPAYLLYGYISAPATIYEGVHKLMPGGILKLRATFTEACEKTARWYSLKDAAERAVPFKGSFEEAAEELERLLLSAVSGQLASDVPLGAYLSGGIDSTTVVALMSRLRPGMVQSFSIGFDDPKYDEAPEAAAIAKHLGTIHTERYVTEKELKEVIPKIPSIYGEPYADSSQIPTYLVSALAKSRVTVSLSGDAGDELFCGYRTYPQIAKLWKVLRCVPQPLRKAAGAVAGITGADIPKLYRAGMCLGAKHVVELKEAVDHYDPLIDRLTASPLSIRRPRPCGDALQAMMRDDLLRYHPEDILVKVDRAGMAVSLENRIPMLDRDVVEFALGLPSDYLFDGKKQKKILKAVLAHYVPEELTERPKKGFAVPLEKWLKEGDTADWAAELTEHSRAAADGLIRGSELKRLWDAFRKNGRSPRLLWNVLMLEQWYRERKRL